MDPIEVIADFLTSHSVEFTQSEDGVLTVPSSIETGFDVSISGESEDFVVHYDSWHEHFNDSTAATRCFLFGLTDRVKLFEERRGNSAFRWTTQSLGDGSWITDSTVGLVFSPFWRKLKVKQLQNSHLSFEQITDFQDQEAPRRAR